MKSLPVYLSALLVLSMVAPLTARAEEVTFVHQGPAVGSREQSSFAMTGKLDMQVEVNGQVAQRSTMNMAEKKSLQETILAANAQASTKSKVQFLEMKASQSQPDGKPQEIIAPVQGKTYLLELKDGTFNATTEDGKPISDEELAVLKKEFRRFGKPDPIEAHLDKKTLRSGQPHEVPVEIARDSFAGEENQTLEKMTVTLKGTREVEGQNCAVLEVVMKMSMQLNPVMKLSMEHKGEALVRVQGARFLNLDLSGPMTISGKATEEGQQIEFKGTGQTNLKAATKLLK